MKPRHVTYSLGLSPALILTLVFIGLKVCGKIGWSWWWVCAPMWLPAAILLAFLLFAFLALVAVILAGAVAIWFFD